MARVLVLEPVCAGHRFQHVRSIAREAVLRGHEVVVGTSSECLDHPLAQSMVDQCGDGVSVLPVFDGAPSGGPGGPWGLARRQLAFRRAFGRAARRAPGAPADLVFVPYADHCAHAVALLGSPFGPTPWAGIVMRTTFHHARLGVRTPPSTLGPLQAPLLLRLLRQPPLRALFTIDELLPAFIAEAHPALGRRLHYLPDPVAFAPGPERDAARAQFGLPPDAPVILAYGALSARKGVDALLRATAVPTFPASVHVLLAGRLSDDLRAVLGEPPATALRETGRLHVADRFLHDYDETAVFRAADVVWLGYRRHDTMSGVLVQAAATGLPVVACDRGLLEWLTNEHGLGLAVPIDDAVRVADAVHLLMRDAELRGQIREHALRYAAGHDRDRVFGMVVDRLELDRRVNSPPT